MRIKNPTKALSQLALIAAAGLFAAGCGGSGETIASEGVSGPGGSSSTSPEASGSESGGKDIQADLKIELSINQEAEQSPLPDSFETGTWTLTCGPAGGDHPKPEAACEALAELGTDIFQPIDQGQACTKIYGGPQQAKVTGTVNGEEVEATFTRANGCALERWKELGAVLAPK